MNTQRNLTITRCVVLAVLLLSSALGVTQEKPHSNRKSACTVEHPESMCSQANTCGSATSPCAVDVKRTSDSASATARTTDHKANALFCVRTGTKVTWQSESKNTGFVIDFGSSSPFDPPGAVIGGSDRSVTVVAKTPGCFKYSAGACVSGAIYGMCDQADADFIVLADN